MVFGFSIFGGGSKEETARLDSVQKLIDEHCDDQGDANLDLFLEAAKDLKIAFDSEVARGARNMKLMRRIEDLSDGILSNLERRITDELLEEAGGPAIAKRCAALAKELDAVRATKASTLLETRTVAMQERLAQEHLKEVTTAYGAVAKDPPSVLEHAPTVLDAVDATHAKAPSSTKITDKLLQYCVQLARVMLTSAVLMKALMADPANGPKAQKIAERLDNLAEKLVAVLDAKWDPPAASQIEAEVAKAAKLVFTHNSGLLEAEVGKESDIDREAIIKVITDLKPWWVVGAEIDECASCFQAACEKVDAKMVDAFGTAAKGGDKAEVDALLKFAEDMDSMTDHFGGIEIADTSLRAKMMEIGFVDVPVKLDALDNELAKRPGEELEVATMNMALTTLEGLAPLWTAAVSGDDSLAERLKGTLDVWEARAAETVSSAPTSKGLQFLKGSVKYDSLCEQLGLDDRSLQKSLAPTVASASLRDVEEELGRLEDFSATSVLKALEACKNPALKSSLEDAEVKSRMVGALRSAEERIVTEGKNAADAVDKKRMQELSECAVRFDALSLEIDADIPAERYDLKTLLQLYFCMSSLETQVATGGELDCEKVNRALLGVAALCKPPKSPPEDIVKRTQDLQAPLTSALFARTLKADEDTMGAVLQCAKHVEIALAAVESREPTEEGGELCEALKNTREVNAAFEILDEELAKDSGLDPNMVMKALQSLKSIWASVAHVADFERRLVGVFWKLDERLCEACEKACADGIINKVQALINFGKLCDDVREAASGDAGICEHLAEVVVAVHVSATEEELQKDSGMHPNKILNSFRNLLPHFSNLSEDKAADLRERLLRVRSTLTQRMGKSLDDATATDKMRRGKALMAFAVEYDSALTNVGMEGSLVELLENRGDDSAPQEPEKTPPLGNEVAVAEDATSGA